MERFSFHGKIVFKCYIEQVRMDIRFLEPREALGELRNSEYLEKMYQGELLARLAPFYPKDSLDKRSAIELRSILDNIYLNSFETFDPLEMETLNLYFDKVCQILGDKGAGQFFLPGGVDQVYQSTIGLIKLNSQGKKLDWGYPYTLNNSIVIPDNFLEKLVLSSQKYHRTVEDVIVPGSGNRPAGPNENLLLAGLRDLYHEVVHILQRSPAGAGSSGVVGTHSLGHMSVHQRFFDTLYSKFWGFERVSRSQIDGRKDLRRQLILVTNPDGDNFEWIITMKIRGLYQTFLPTIVFDMRTQKPAGALIHLEPVTDFRLSETFGSQRRWRLTGRAWDIGGTSEEALTYRDLFYGLQCQLYHPNEISAQLLSDYLVLGKMWGNDYRAFPFYQYIDKFVYHSPHALS